MKPPTIGRILTAVIIGVLFAGALHFDHLKGSKMGREEFVVRQGERFDRQFAKPEPVALELFVGVFLAGCLFGTYELVAFGIAKTLKSIGKSEDSG